MALGLVPDVTLEKGEYNVHDDEWADTTLNTPWHVADETFRPQTHELKLDIPAALKDSQILLFAIGIEMGVPTPYGNIEEVKYAGSACILAVG
jgi:hypothetical protein